MRALPHVPGLEHRSHLTVSVLDLLLVVRLPAAARELQTPQAGLESSSLRREIGAHLYIYIHSSAVRPSEEVYISLHSISHLQQLLFILRELLIRAVHILS